MTTRLEEAQLISAELVKLRGDLDETFKLLEDVEIKTLLAVQYRLENTGLALLSPTVQATIDLRLHDEQIEASNRLRISMESVSKTLVEVERRQRRIEYVGVFLGGVGLLLAGIQVWVTILSSQ